ncbi:MAG: GTP cyclohydrolase IIa [Halobacteria archaeon]|nr:GTP cyclohydrolase IIa [Halobacteria archaeon]
MVQITLIQIDNYGPWTVTPEPRREADLQTLQSRLFADLSQTFGSYGCLVFFTRFDNMIAVTNGMDVDDHLRVQESVSNRYPVSVSMSIGCRDTPRDALLDATESLQTAGSAQDEERQEELLGGEACEIGDTAQIAHFDVNDATEKYTDELNAFDSFIHIERGYASLMEYMWKQESSASFFVGGDNVISVTRDLGEKELLGAIEHVENEAEVELKVGAGRSETPEEASMDAKIGLEDCRENGDRVVIL